MIKYSGCRFSVRKFRKYLFIKNPSSDKYKYSDYGLFDARGGFLLSDSTKFGKNMMIFGVEMRSLVHIDKTKKISRFLLKFQ